MGNSTIETFISSTCNSIDYNAFASLLFLYEYEKTKTEDAYVDGSSEQDSGEFETTSNFKTQRVPLVFEQKATNAVLEKLKEERINAVDYVTPIITKCLIDYSYDDDSMELIWPHIDKILKEYSISIIGEALQSIYVSHNDYPNVMSGICRVLMGFELEEASPWGPVMLAGLLNHRNETVKEHAVMLLENWCDKTLLPILTNLDCRSEWLRDYIKSVITYLEG